jgi:hypothetical protein
LEQFVFLPTTNRRIPKAPVDSWFGNSPVKKEYSSPERNPRTDKKVNTSEGYHHAEAASPTSPRERLEAYKYLASTTKNYAKNRTSPEAAQERREAFDRLEGAESMA